MSTKNKIFAKQWNRQKCPSYLIRDFQLYSNE